MSIPSSVNDDSIQFSELSPIEKLLTLMRMLRDKKHGCPWDLEQTIATLAPYTLEEVYEVVDAIEKQDMFELEDELGDLLFQVVFYAQIANEEGKFDFTDIANRVARKLIRRHPHVFPEGRVENFGNTDNITSSEVVVNWEAIKQQERAEKLARGGQGSEHVQSTLDDVPSALPALERARKLQKRAANVGFDWDSIEPVLEKLKEEVEEFEEALAEKTQSRLHHELGDILFAAVNLARHTKVEPELALREANRRFENRFRWIEQQLQIEQRGFAECTLDELDALWEQAKQFGL